MMDFEEILKQDGVNIHGSWQPVLDERGLGKLVIGDAPLEKLKISPFGRPPSMTHIKKLTEAIQLVGVFIDPLLVVRTEKGEYWIVNGQHRFTVLQRLGMQKATCIFVEEGGLSTLYLYLNTERAMDIREKSIVVARMWLYFRDNLPEHKEGDLEVFFESSMLLTLGLAQELGYTKRISATVWTPLLRVVDYFFQSPIGEIADQRIERAKLLAEASDLLNETMKEIMERTMYRDKSIARSILMHDLRKDLSGDYVEVFRELMQRMRTFDRQEFIARLNNLAMSSPGHTLTQSQ
jgi:ParB family chromosome partitioning protein